MADCLRQSADTEESTGVIHTMPSQTIAEQSTPGPWTYDRSPRFGPTDGCVITTVSSGSRAAFIGEVYRHADGLLIASAPELLACLKEMRDACTAAMRVVADLDQMHLLGLSAETRGQRFVDELKVVGVTNGFGVRADHAIAKAEGHYTLSVPV